jgi:peptidoglycan/LPS O-acetylase OafA/YrhL
MEPTNASGQRPAIAALDGLRGLAILLVAAYHFGLPYLERFKEPGDAIIAGLVGWGWSGVDLFFVLSGYLITSILLDTKHADNYLQSFFARRLLRIFPLYYAFLAFWFWVLPLFELVSANSAPAVFGFHQQAWYWTYSQNIANALGRYVPGLGHFWSLAIEEQFYLVWPCVVLGVRGPRRLLVWSLGLAGLAMLLRVLAVWLEAGPEVAYRLTVCRMDALLAGASVSAATRAGLHPILVRRARAIVLGSALALAILAAFSEGLLRTHPLTQTAGFSLFAVAFTGLLVLALQGQGVSKVLSVAWLRSLGKYSYGVYVFHWPIALFGAIALRRAGVLDSRLSHVAFVPAGILMTYILARISWWLLEAPFLAYKDHFSARSAPGGTRE